MSPATTSIDAQPIPRGISIREFAKSQGMAEASIRRRVGTGEIPSYKVGGARRIPLSYLEKVGARRPPCRTSHLSPPGTSPGAAPADQPVRGRAAPSAAGRCGMTRDQWPPGGRNDGGPATVGKAGPTSNQNQPPPSTRFNRQTSAPRRHFHAGGRRRREAALRLPPIGRCGCIRDPDLDEHRCGARPLTEHQFDGWRATAEHILEGDSVPIVPVEAVRAMWRRGGRDRQLAQQLWELVG